MPGPKGHVGHPPRPPHEAGSGHPPPPPHEHGPERAGEAGFDLRRGPGFGFSFGLGGTGARQRSFGSSRRGRRGDVRAAILTLLAERPMHGYEMIQEITQRSQDLWRPSPGSVYPTLQLLDDEGLITGSDSEGSKKLFELTDEGRAAAEKIRRPPWEEITEGVDSGQVDLRTALGQLFGAVAQSADGASPQQQQRILAILKNARREIYTLLAESE
ncbi:PadR family transcriptional regulator [Mycobacterium sp. SM1]|uniref:PadR family transcriptional regulator n=1 Tax=Mycobacterium sp. SM1 TaxID=2816243 RepID=UPI001BD02113|nr:PadR family transcriptional regulator [Mycobacterium sp. SM1]